MLSASSGMVQLLAEPKVHGGEYSSGIVHAELQYPLAGLQIRTRLDGAGDIGLQQFLKQLPPIAFGQGVAINISGQVTEVPGISSAIE